MVWTYLAGLEESQLHLENGCDQSPTVKLTPTVRESSCRECRMEDKLEVAGMVDGLRTRSHRIRALGNAVVPIQAKAAFEELMGL